MRKNITKIVHPSGGQGFFFVSILAVTLLYLYYKSVYFAGFHTGSARSAFSNILLQSWVSFFYIRLFLWPDNLNFFHVNPDINSLLQPEALFFGGIIIIIVLIIALRKKNYLLSLGLFFYLTGLVPKFYAALKVPVSEHHFYLASIGIYIILTAVLTKLYLRNRRFFLYPAVGIIIVFTILTVERNYQLTNPLRIWTIGVKKEPHHPGNWINLAGAYYSEGNPYKAEKILERTSRVFTKKTGWQNTIYINLASIYFNKGEDKKGLTLLNKALSTETVSSRLYTIYKMLGTFYAKENNEKKAINYFDKALELSPYSYDIYQSIGKLYIKNNKFNKAKKSIEKALKIKPRDFYSYFLEGKIYDKEGNLERAEEFYKKSIEGKPDWFESHYALCKIYIKQDNLLFIKELKETLKLKPTFKPALNLARILLKPKK